MSLLVDIKKSLGGFALDVQFEAGNEVMALLGASGCGKSMTLKCIAGVVKPDSGVIIADGRVLFDSKKGVNLPPQQRKTGMLFQNYALFPNMTVRENLLAGSRGAKKGKNGAKSLGGLLSRFYLEGLENRYPRQLSGGQQQRAALARLMAGDPAVIMLDEPLSALDSYLRWQLEQELAQTLEEFGGTTIYVSHDRGEVYRISRKVCPMTGGRAKGACGTRELFESPRSLTACLLSGCKNYSRAEKKDEKTVFAPDWLTQLTCAAPVPDGTSRVGVRAHHVGIAKNGESVNVIRCRVLRVTEDLFSTIITALPLGAEPKRGFSRLRVELPAEEARGVEAGGLVDLSIKPENVIPLNG